MKKVDFECSCSRACKLTIHVVWCPVKSYWASVKFYLQEICSSTCVAGTELLKEPASSGETTSWYAGGAEAAILVVWRRGYWKASWPRRGSRRSEECGILKKQFTPLLLILERQCFEKVLFNLRFSYRALVQGTFDLPSRDQVTWQDARQCSQCFSFAHHLRKNQKTEMEMSWKHEIFCPENWKIFWTLHQSRRTQFRIRRKI